MGNAVHNNPLMCFYNAFCKKKNEKKCGDIRNTQAVVSLPLMCWKTKRILFSCSFILSFHSGEGICFSRGGRKKNFDLYCLLAKEFLCSGEIICFFGEENSEPEWQQKAHKIYAAVSNTACAAKPESSK